MPVAMRAVVVAVTISVATARLPAVAQEYERSSRAFATPTFRLAQAEERAAGEAGEEIEAYGHGYRGVSKFFNVREAYSNVTAGEWELELTFEWETSSGEDDEFEMEQSIKYGLTDRFHIEFEVAQPNLGDGGGSGAGDTGLVLFYNWNDEGEVVPAIGTYVQGRFPTGDGSEGVDVTLGTSLTKCVAGDLRCHLFGFVMSANGEVGDPREEDYDRRDFQWGVGVGLDYQLSEQTLVGLSYLNRSHDEYGNPNQNLLEVLCVQEIGEFWGAEHEIKTAVDVGLDGHESTPNFAAKIQWAIEW